MTVGKEMASDLERLELVKAEMARMIDEGSGYANYHGFTFYSFQDQNAYNSLSHERDALEQRCDRHIYGDPLDRVRYSRALRRFGIPVPIQPRLTMQELQDLCARFGVAPLTAEEVK